LWLGRRGNTAETAQTKHCKLQPFIITGKGENKMPFGNLNTTIRTLTRFTSTWRQVSRQYGLGTSKTLFEQGNTSKNLFRHASSILQMINSDQASWYMFKREFPMYDACRGLSRFVENPTKADLEYDKCNFLAHICEKNKDRSLASIIGLFKKNGCDIDFRCLTIGSDGNCYIGPFLADAICTVQFSDDVYKGLLACGADVNGQVSTYGYSAGPKLSILNFLVEFSNLDFDTRISRAIELIEHGANTTELYQHLELKPYRLYDFCLA
jgi:hypothetical protein